jgi:hypothetical protein
MTTHADIANRYRAEFGYHTGIVVIYDGDISGWMNELRDPQHWMPGCIAVDVDGNTWLATGGNEADGATNWDPIKEAA